MSMSIRCEQCGLEYAGGRGVKGMLAQRSRAVDRQFLRLLADVRRFHRRASHFLETGADDDLSTYGQFLEREGFGTHFISRCMPRAGTPRCSADVWRSTWSA